MPTTPRKGCPGKQSCSCICGWMEGPGVPLPYQIRGEDGGGAATVKVGRRREAIVSPHRVCHVSRQEGLQKANLSTHRPSLVPVVQLERCLLLAVSNPSLNLPTVSYSCNPAPFRGAEIRFLICSQLLAPLFWEGSRTSDEQMQSLYLGQPGVTFSLLWKIWVERCCLATDPVPTPGLP